MSSFLEQLYSITAHRLPRENIRNWVLNQPDLMPDLVQVALDVENRYHFKACWVLELVVEADISLIKPYLSVYCNTLAQYSNDSAIRCIAKIAMMMVSEHYSTKPKITLTDSQIEQITETLMDWLISDQKVAAKAYSAEALYILGKTQDWIYPELKEILGQGYHHHSAAYKAVSRKLIQLINKNSN